MNRMIVVGISCVGKGRIVKPKMQSVSSSNVRAIGYDDATKTLYVDFHKGSSYKYFAVPKSVYEAFLASSSKGSFVWTNLRDRFRFERVS